MNGGGPAGSEPGVITRTLGLIVTNGIKIAGVWIGLKQAAKPVPDAFVLAYSGFMMAGAQVSEAFAMRLVDRLFGLDRDQQGRRH